LLAARFVFSGNLATAGAFACGCDGISLASDQIGVRHPHELAVEDPGTSRGAPNVKSHIAAVCITALLGLPGVISSVNAAQSVVPNDLPSSVPSVRFSGPPDLDIPVQGWPVDVLGGISKLNALNGTGMPQPKAASDPSTVFRPIAPCRLIDTRGQPAAISIGGVFTPTQRRTVAPNGACGIPTSFVKGLSLAVITLNYTPNSGGYIAILPPGAPVTAIADVFNIGSSWSSAAYNTNTSLAGAFDIYVESATAEIAIDVNGYYQDMDFVDIGGQELDYSGNPVGDVLEARNTGSGGALAGSAAGPGGRALTLYGGSISVAGAGVNTTGPAFIHRVLATCSGGTASNINHPMLNGASNALVYLTPRYSGVAPAVVPPAGPFRARYGLCSANQWAIQNASGAMTVNSEFSVLVIKP
jgi:hypothetical protein